jgi:hypothetical protein
MQQTDELTETVEGADTEIPSSTDDDGNAGRLGGRFSAKALLVSLVAVAAGVGVGGAIPLVGGITSLAGVAAATFVLGILAGESRYLETGLAGGVVVGANFALSLLTSAALPIGIDFFQQYGLAFGGIGVVVGVGLGLVGHYFGRDLRDGLTREI